MDKMVIDPLQLAQLSKRLDEEEEDYDEEGWSYYQLALRKD
jgi:tetrahydromethanopterin S-methyltransferase subunit G